MCHEQSFHYISSSSLNVPPFLYNILALEWPYPRLKQDPLKTYTRFAGTRLYQLQFFNLMIL